MASGRIERHEIFAKLQLLRISLSRDLLQVEDTTPSTLLWYILQLRYVAILE